MILNTRLLIISTIGQQNMLSPFFFVSYPYDVYSDDVVGASIGEKVGSETS